VKIRDFTVTYEPVMSREQILAYIFQNQYPASAQTHYAFTSALSKDPQKYAEYYQEKFRLNHKTAFQLEKFQVKTSKSQDDFQADVSCNSFVLNFLAENHMSELD
jgi:hypothetical protein